jgi:hypothetical protein
MTFGLLTKEILSILGRFFSDQYALFKVGGFGLKLDLGGAPRTGRRKIPNPKGKKVIDTRPINMPEP